ncbi:hypothetical protein ABE527_14665 [Brucella sp. TWI432]
MSLRDVIKNASPELLKSATNRGEFYEALAKVMDVFDAIKKRLDALEEGGIKYRGVHQRAQGYRKGDVATFKGDSWIALRSINETEEPGKCDGWQLMAKAGKDA